MKTRLGYVSNSSSSSFVIARELLTKEQIESLEKFCEEPVGPYHDKWNIYFNHIVEGFCDMNNNCDEPGGLEWWMKENGFPMEAIKWEHN